jgi:hypothetical protein
MSPPGGAPPCGAETRRPGGCLPLAGGGGPVGPGVPPTAGDRPPPGGPGADPAATVPACAPEPEAARHRAGRRVRREARAARRAPRAGRAPPPAHSSRPGASPPGRGQGDDGATPMPRACEGPAARPRLGHGVLAGTFPGRPRRGGQQRSATGAQCPHVLDRGQRARPRSTEVPRRCGCACRLRWALRQRGQLRTRRRDNGTAGSARGCRVTGIPTVEVPQ